MAYLPSSYLFVIAIFSECCLEEKSENTYFRQGGQEKIEKKKNRKKRLKDVVFLGQVNVVASRYYAKQAYQREGPAQKFKWPDPYRPTHARKIDVCVGVKRGEKSISEWR